MISHGQTEDRVADITRLAGNAELVNALRVHVEDIIHKEAFSGSHRSQDFLRFVVEKAIECDFQSLKERVIGAELFQRPPSYDTGDDAIVRVTASDVRKRLLQHYGRYGSGAGFRIAIPSGSYIPEIVYNSDTDSLDGSAVADPPNTSSAELPIPQSSTPVKLESQFHAKPILALALIILSLPISFWAGYRIHQSQVSPATSLVLPWSAVFLPGHTVEIVGSDSQFARVQQMAGYPNSLSDYANARYFPNGPSLLPETRRFYQQSLSGADFPQVDVSIAADLVAIAKSRSANVHIRSARTLRLADFETNEDFILLGSPLSNPWDELYAQHLDFWFMLDKKTGLEYIQNLHPKGEELPLYVPTGLGLTTGTSFAIFAFMQNPNQAGHIILVAGANAEGTEAAGRLATDIPKLSQALQNCNISPNGPTQHFEILLQLDMMAGSPTSSKVIACHRLAAQ